MVSQKTKKLENDLIIHRLSNVLLTVQSKIVAYKDTKNITDENAREYMQSMILRDIKDYLQDEDTFCDVWILY